ncbi:MAG TPA: hypothetical protein V6D12_08345, partial [Candidatus Obscuribacterales bacterium]
EELEKTRAYFAIPPQIFLLNNHLRRNITAAFLAKALPKAEVSSDSLIERITVFNSGIFSTSSEIFTFFDPTNCTLNKPESHQVSDGAGLP